ncbi:Steroleosin [Zea mays]|uniref:Steroleosin n=1 Tax=Zea mays TaxID=4577 RepID=A0A1D6ECG2_MAIZE|nr:Steroleosin [Zea mays]
MLGMSRTGLAGAALRVALTALLPLVLPAYYVYKLTTYLLGAVFPEDVAGKVVLITGASSGIGEHLAYEYAKRGAYLALVARREASLREVGDVALGLGSPGVLVLPADVSKPRDCEGFIDDTISYFGRLDHLVNNASIWQVCKFEEIQDVRHLRALMDINFWGHVYPTRLAIPHLQLVLHIHREEHLLQCQQGGGAQLLRHPEDGAGQRHPHHRGGARRGGV